MHILKNNQRNFHFSKTQHLQSLDSFNYKSKLTYFILTNKRYFFLFCSKSHGLVKLTQSFPYTTLFKETTISKVVEYLLQE